MIIVVLVKQVLDKDSNINLAADGSLLNREDLALSTNECDSYALEEALQIKEKKGGEVIVLSVGNDSVLSVSSLVMGIAKENESGPITVNQLTDIPAADLIELDSSELS